MLKYAINTIIRLPVVGKWLIKFNSMIARRRFNSAEYWENRYRGNGNSGAGSYGRLAEFKAKIINTFVNDNNIQSVIEFGCGDGNQLVLARYPPYLGFDVSREAIRMCKERFAEDGGKQFHEVFEYNNQQAELAMSLDVIFHVVEDEVFEAYMVRLFDAATRYVLIYSSDTDSNQPGSPPHLRHRKFTRWIEGKRPEWRLLEEVPSRYPFDGDHVRTSFSNFYFYGQRC